MSIPFHSLTDSSFKAEFIFQESDGRWAYRDSLMQGGGYYTQEEAIDAYENRLIRDTPVGYLFASSDPVLGWYVIESNGMARRKIGPLIVAWARIGPAPQPAEKNDGSACTPVQTGGSQPAEGGDRFADIKADRQSKYGPIHENHANIGMVWTGIINSWLASFGEPPIQIPPIPAFLVPGMMAALKLVRAAFARVEDSYVDAEHYVDISKRLDRRPEVK